MSLRKIKSIDSEKFGQDLSEKLSTLTLPNDVSDAFSLFGETISTALDKHAPLQENFFPLDQKCCGTLQKSWRQRGKSDKQKGNGRLQIERKTRNCLSQREISTVIK